MLLPVRHPIHNQFFLGTKPGQSFCGLPHVHHRLAAPVLFEVWEMVQPNSETLFFENPKGLLCQSSRGHADASGLKEGRLAMGQLSENG